MGSKERRVREREVLRQEILDAARDLFVKEGYDNVSMRKVAEKIEYSPTTIYLYFKDKSELLFSICEETFSSLVKEFEVITRETSDPVECLRKGLRAYVDFGLEHPNHYKLTFINHPSDHKEELQSRMKDSMGMRAYSYLPMLVDACARQEKFRKLDVELASQALWAAVHGITSLLIVHTHFPWSDRDRLIDHLIDTLIAGMTG